MAFGLFDKLITAIYPDRCLLCGGVVARGQLCCGSCSKALPFQPQGRVEAEKDDPFSFVAVPFLYQDGIRNAIIQ
ncbi:MAG: hypothetical protein J6Q99_04705, partial [Oscillospiraceae bacterium]|nr:hypothetical protein [Oscillospiraceae bacterium]